MLPPYLQPEHAVSMQTLDGGSNRPILAAPCFIAAVSDAPDKLPYHSLPQMSIFLPIISVKVPCQMLGMELLQNAVRLCLKTERAKQIHETLSGDSRFLYITCACPRRKAATLCVAIGLRGSNRGRGPRVSANFWRLAACLHCLHVSQEFCTT